MSKLQTDKHANFKFVEIQKYSIFFYIENLQKGWE